MKVREHSFKRLPRESSPIGKMSAGRGMKLPARAKSTERIAVQPTDDNMSNGLRVKRAQILARNDLSVAVGYHQFAQ